MKDTRWIMGMPITVEVVDNDVTPTTFERVFAYFVKVDEKFSTYKKDSEISRINKGEIREQNFSKDMKTIFTLSEQTKEDTEGFFQIKKDGGYDPSGIVKGWAIKNASQIITSSGFENYYIEAGGDIQMSGYNKDKKLWTVGIRSPYNREEIIKVLRLTDRGVATSGIYIRGQHIYNPFNMEREITEIVSFTVVGPDIYEADRFATAAFAMGKKGVEFIEKLDGFEGYMIDSDGVATYTSGFTRYTNHNAFN